MRTNVKIVFILFLIFIFSIMIYLLIGPVSLFSVDEHTMQTILFQIRIPRLVLAIIVGSSLSISGIILQALLQNPLAEPYILGSSSGAALGVTLSLLIGIKCIFFPFTSFIFASLSIFLVYNLAKRNKIISKTNLILSGIVVNAFLSSLVMLILNLQKEDISTVVFWLMGNLQRTDIFLLKISGMLMLLILIITYLFSFDLNLFTLGEEKAIYVGLNVELRKRLFFILASFLTAIAVSLSGIIGFVGIIIPHIMRRIVGTDHRILIPLSCFAGSIFLILSDLLARTIISPIELPVGVITALCGGPFFLYILNKTYTRS